MAAFMKNLKNKATNALSSIFVGSYSSYGDISVNEL